MAINSILIIDDCDNFRIVASNILLDAGYVVEDAACPYDAFKIIEKERFDLILCDLHMPFTLGEDRDQFQTSYQVGIMTIQELQGLYPDTPVVALTSTDPGDIARIKSALRGINTFSKPVNKQELFAIVEGAQEKAQYSGYMQ